MTTAEHETSDLRPIDFRARVRLLAGRCAYLLRVGRLEASIFDESVPADEVDIRPLSGKRDMGRPVKVPSLADLSKLPDVPCKFRGCPNRGAFTSVPAKLKGYCFAHVRQDQRGQRMVPIGSAPIGRPKRK